MKKIVRTMELTWETTESTAVRRSSSTRIVNLNTVEGESIESSANGDVCKYDPIDNEVQHLPEIIREEE